MSCQTACVTEHEYQAGEASEVKCVKVSEHKQPYTCMFSYTSASQQACVPHMRGAWLHKRCAALHSAVKAHMLHRGLGVHMPSTVRGDGGEAEADRMQPSGCVHVRVHLRARALLAALYRGSGWPHYWMYRVGQSSERAGKGMHVGLCYAHMHVCIRACMAWRASRETRPPERQCGMQAGGKPRNRLSEEHAHAHAVRMLTVP